MKKYRLILVIYGVLLACACSPDSGKVDLPRKNTGVMASASKYDMEPSELKEVTERAEAGDLRSIRRLIDYYHLVSDTPSQSLPWLERAVEMEDAPSMVELANQLSLDGDEVGCRRAWELLARAQESGQLTPGQFSALKAVEQSILHGGGGGDGCAQWLEPLNKGR